MKDQKLTEQQKKDIDLLSKLPKETQENLISYAAGMIEAQQILSRLRTDRLDANEKGGEVYG